MAARTSFADAECPIARSVDQVGDWWSLLILRDALDGLCRFDDFEKSLAIPPSTLTRRLAALVDDGLLDRRVYQDRPARHEYALTERGRSFQPVVLALLAWGNHDLAPADRRVVLVDRDTGRAVDPVLIDRETGHPLEEMRLEAVPGPSAGKTVHHRYDIVRAARSPSRRHP